LKPDNGILDMLADVDGERFYFEVKIWQNLTQGQFDRQVEYIKSKKARGFYILFTRAADKWSYETIAERSGGCCSLVGANELMKALNAARSYSRPELAEIAKAYKAVLKDIRRRW
jgi:hypothetical protein